MTIIALGVAASVATVWTVHPFREEGAGPANAPASSQATSEPLPTSGATATAQPVPGEPFGVPIQDITAGEAVRFPELTVLYYAWAAIEGPIHNLWRAYRGADGEMRYENLYSHLPPGDPFTTAFDLEHGELAVGLCRQSYCGGYGSPMPDSQAVLATSSDGGISWVEQGSLPLATFPVGFTADGLLMQHFTSLETFTREFYYWPSGLQVSVPDGKFANVRDGEIFFTDEGLVRNQTGDVVWKAPALDVEGPPRPMWAGSGWSWLSWSDQETADSGSLYYAQRDGERYVRVLRIRDGATYLLAALDDLTWFGRRDDYTNANGPQPLLIDIEGAAAHPILDLAKPGGYFAPFAARRGRFGEAAPGTGCLNIRSEPSLGAGALACVANGVLLFMRDEPEQRMDDITWLAVQLPDGRDGWASAEFVTR
jgi:hypothetical protein